MSHKHTGAAENTQIQLFVPTNDYHKANVEKKNLAVERQKLLESAQSRLSFGGYLRFLEWGRSGTRPKDQHLKWSRNGTTKENSVTKDTLAMRDLMSTLAHKLKRKDNAEESKQKLRLSLHNNHNLARHNPWIYTVRHLIMTVKYERQNKHTHSNKVRDAGIQDHVVREEYSRIWDDIKREGRAIWSRSRKSESRLQRVGKTKEIIIQHYQWCQGYDLEKVSWWLEIKVCRFNNETLGVSQLNDAPLNSKIVQSNSAETIENNAETTSFNVSWLRAVSYVLWWMF